jgi:GTPase SAR1 family protein
MWMKNLSDRAQPNIIRFLVASKLDLAEQRTVSTEEDQHEARQYGAACHEISALTATDVCGEPRDEYDE